MLLHLPFYKYVFRLSIAYDDDVNLDVITWTPIFITKKSKILCETHSPAVFAQEMATAITPITIIAAAIILRLPKFSLKKTTPSIAPIKMLSSLTGDT